MRVLHWLNTFLPDTGGIQTLCAELLPALADRGHEIVLLTAHTHAGYPDREQLGGVDVRRVDCLRTLLMRNPAGILRARIEIRRIIEEFDPDIVHLHPCGPDLLHFNEIYRHRPMRTVITLHNNYSRAGIDFGPESLFGCAFSVASRIAAVSDESRRWLVSLRPDLEGLTRTIHNGIPPASTEPAPLPWAPPTLLYTGRIDRQKRVDVLLEAFEILAASHADVRLRIAGNGTELPEIEEQVAASRVAGRIELLGRVDLELVPRLIDEATIVVLSSDWEGLPIAVLEAARQGRPVVATAVGGVPEAVVHGETGLLVEPESPGAFAGAMAELLDDPERTQRLGDRARVRFDEAFTLEACADAYEDLYEELAAEVARGLAATG